jgi:hypothetical protein
MPNIAALSDAQCNQLREYVRRGGSIVATYETSLCDEWGNRRSDFGLAELFGASYDSTPKGPVQNTYLYVERDAAGAARSPLLLGLEDVETMIGGTYQVNVRAHSGHEQQPLMRIPAVANLPMEKTFWTVDKTDIPDVYMNEVGAGRVVYFPWDIDRVYWDVMANDHAMLLRNAFVWAMNERSPVRVTGMGMFDVTAWRQRDSMTIHLVNLTNPMAMRPQMHELIPSHPQTIEIDVPAGKRVKAVHTLMKLGELAHQIQGNTLYCVVPTILDYEVVAVDLV